jgi:surface protein
MGEMFSFLTLTSLDLSGFDTSELVTASGMFRGCKNLKTIYCQDNRDVWKCALGDKMFDSCYALVGSDGRSEIAYNKNKTDASMAKAVGMGGYFTPKIDTLVLKKTARGDMFNLANTVKITWKAVPDAKYYKVYRKDITSGVQSNYELVFVTSKLVGWDKDPRLEEGHAYKYKIVASLTGKGDPSGNSPFAYFKTMYRLKTVVIRTAKNTEPGKVTVRYDKTKSGDSYVIGYSENEDMTGMKTKVVKGADSTSCTISGLKKGKTYYISIRVRKTVGGVNYYTTFGVPKKVTITN